MTDQKRSPRRVQMTRQRPCHADVLLELANREAD